MMGLELMIIISHNNLIIIQGLENMIDTIQEHANLIFSEMMTHTVLFTHPNPKTIVLVGDNIDPILDEVLKHANILEIYYSKPKKEQKENSRVIFNTNLSLLKANSIDIIINASEFNLNQTKHCFELLHKDGILIQQSVSPFVTNPLKLHFDALHQIGFSDIQLLSFPQPNYDTGWRSILMSLKHGMFKRLREKIIFNKSFQTMYYNFDVHKASIALPEFIRNINLF